LRNAEYRLSLTRSLGYWSPNDNQSNERLRHSPYGSHPPTGSRRPTLWLLACLLVALALVYLAPQAVMSRLYTPTAVKVHTATGLHSGSQGRGVRPHLGADPTVHGVRVEDPVAQRAQAHEQATVVPLPALVVFALAVAMAALCGWSRRTPSALSPLRMSLHMAAVGSAVEPLANQNKGAGPRRRVLVVGPTGYIGKFVTLEMIRRGYAVVAVARERSGVKGKLSKDDVIAQFPGAEVVFGDVSDPESIARVFRDHGGAEGIDTVVSCLASRTGGVADSWKIDYQATSNVLQAARAHKARHFVLLSAICVQKPLLEFQRAKLRFEEELMTAGDISYSIVRPTAFFKSLAGQVKSVMGGGFYVMFGDGQLAACKPISERDLASFMADCVEDETLKDRVLPIGGPGEAMTALQQGEMLFKILDKKPFFLRVPVAVMDVVIGALDFFKQFNADLVDAAEFGRIGRYYATESMLLYDSTAQCYLPGSETPSYGTDTLEAFYRSAVKEGGLAGQELGDAAVFGD